MTVETWHQARLIRTSGIAGADERERRATSAVLAVMGVVREFCKAVLGPLGAPAGTVETSVEVPFMLGEKRWRGRRSPRLDPREDDLFDGVGLWSCDADDEREREGRQEEDH